MSRRKPAKTNIISLRFTNEELDAIESHARALNLTRTAYLQNLVTHHKDRPIEAKANNNRNLYIAYLPFIQELKRQGNNLNQIARGINRANLEGMVFNGYIRSLSQIEAANRELANQIAKLGARL